MALTKTQDVNILTVQQVAAGAVVNSSVWSVADYLEALIAVQIGRDDTGGALTSGVIVRIQASPKSTGDDCWQDLRTYQTNITNPESEAVTGGGSSGQAAMTVSSLTNLSIGDLVLIKNSTIANSEFHRIKGSSAGTVTVDDNLTNSQASSTIYDQAEKFADIVPVMSFARLRVQIDNAANARTIVAEAKASAGTI